MRRRLLVVTTALIAALLCALAVPMLGVYAAGRTQDLFVERVDDATRFAVLTSRAIEGGDVASLSTELERYQDVLGVRVVVTDADNRVVTGSDGETPGAPVADDEVAAAADQVLDGDPQPPPSTAWPWVGEPMLVAVPVGRDAQVLGAVVLLAPTDGAQADVARWLAITSAAGLVVLLAGAAAVALPVAGWVVRPVRDLDRAAHRLADGDLGVRVDEREGPPELRRLATSFNQMADSLVRSQQQQRDLVADASHQLGNPLAALRLRVENLRRTASAQQDDDAEHALAETGRLGGIVAALLDLGQVGSTGPALEDVDVAAAARERCSMWAPMFTRLEVDAPPVALARARPGLIELVLDALLDNAAKYAPGAPVDVEVATGPGTRTTVRVRDRGDGLDVDDVAKVGERFFRGRRHQNVQGTGLGLAIVRARTVEAGGTFAVRPADGGGLEVEVALPPVSGPPRGTTARRPGAGRPAR